MGGCVEDTHNLDQMIIILSLTVAAIAEKLALPNKTKNISKEAEIWIEEEGVHARTVQN